MAHAGDIGTTDPSDEQPHGPSLNLLMIGKTGHGKTLTSHSILGTETEDFPDSTDKVCSANGCAHGHRVTVVDTPGMYEPSMDDESSYEKFVEGFRDAFASCPEGFHAILVVIGMGTRMTKEEVETLDTMKDVFGKSAFKDHGILVFTNGDQFEKKMKGKKSFESWCEEQGDYMGEMIKRCQNRCVLFNNVTDDEQIKGHQICKLFEVIDKQIKGETYKMDIFEKTSQKWKLTRREWKDAEIEEQIHVIFGRIISMDSKTDFADLKHLCEEAEALADQLNDVNLKQSLTRELKELSKRLHSEKMSDGRAFGPFAKFISEIYKRISNIFLAFVMTRTDRPKSEISNN